MYPFDPTYGYDEQQLLAVRPPRPPRDFADFWQRCYLKALQQQPTPRLTDIGSNIAGWQIWDLRYHSTQGVILGGWLLVPADGIVERACIVGHGYGGRDAPDFDLPFARTALLFPCCRGLGRSAQPPFSSNPYWHVLHDIDKRERYILRGCVEDLWLSVSALLRIYPHVQGRIGLMGVSFSGGVGTMAAAFDPRIARCHFNVPSFGHQSLRLRLKTQGSGASVQRMCRRNTKQVLRTLRYYDAAIAAQFLTQPTHVACALFDPSVAPPGQYAIYNGLAGPKQLFTLSAGHHDYAEQPLERARLIAQLQQFFDKL